MVFLPLSGQTLFNSALKTESMYSWCISGFTIMAVEFNECVISHIVFFKWSALKNKQPIALYSFQLGYPDT